MRTLRDRQNVFRAHKLGLNVSAIARDTGVSRTTVREWLQHPPKPPKRVDFVSLPKREYAYLLGLYLGDGTISRSKKGVYRLRITMDMRYSGIITECIAAMAAVMPANIVNVQKLQSNAVEISAWSKLWPELFPQHGPGRKHQRKIELAPWQERAVARFPRDFLRGLIHSDGSRCINRVNGGEYPRYFFTQVSDDIQKLFCDTCDFLEIEWKQNKWNSISIARRRSVERMDSFVGPKS